MGVQERGQARLPDPEVHQLNLITPIKCLSMLSKNTNSRISQVRKAGLPPLICWRLSYTFQLLILIKSAA